MKADTKGHWGTTLSPLRPHHLESAADELRSDPAARQRLRHLGVDEGDDTRRHAIVGDRLLAVDVELEAVLRGVVADL
jgi:hypothetical protein